MASPSNVCTSCLRAARRVAPRNPVKPSTFLSPAFRPYSITSGPPSALYLDFLAPSARRIHKRPASPINLVSKATATSPSAQRRSFATEASRTPTPPLSDPQPAHAILHPRTTPSGDPMRISISPRAAHRLSTISTTDNNPNLALRVTIESGGCHGFQYLMSLTDLSKEPATEEDTLFEGDKGAKVVVDEASLELLNGSTVDYTMELIGSQFKVTGIPGATSSCGCGTSFDIKF